jgi:hypothetical protein
MSSKEAKDITSLDGKILSVDTIFEGRGNIRESRAVMCKFIPVKMIFKH